MKSVFFTINKLIYNYFLKFLAKEMYYYFFRMKFRGKSEDKLILCTEDKTFDVKSAQTSNSFLIIPHLKFPSEFGNNESSLIKRNVSSLKYLI